jgi:acetyl-CoA C-acetyltransferase
MSDGAGAAVVTTFNASSNSHVEIMTSQFSSGPLWTSVDDAPWGFRTVASTAARAFAETGLSVQDVDVFEVHDAFTIGEILTLEAIGVAAQGHGAELAPSGHTQLGGPQPVNPSGGLLSRGHPLGSTGLAQTAELVWQLRGQAADRQVADAEIALLETMGGGAAGVDANACVIALLRGPTR